MRICYIATTVHISQEQNECIGCSTHTFALSKEFVKQGHSVHLVSKKIGSEKDFEEIQGINVFRFFRGIVTSGETVRKTKKFGISPILRTFANIALGFKIAKIAKENNCDIIFERAHSLQAGMIASMVSKKPLFIEVIDNFYSNIALSRAKKVFAYNASFFSKKILPKVVLVDAGFDPKIFKPIKVKQEFDLCYIGAFKNWDGLEDLVFTVKHLKNQKNFEDLKVLLLGQGVKFDFIKNLIKENGLEKNFLMPGKVSLGEVPNYINASKICVAPFNVNYSKAGDFKKHGFYFSPLKIIEYMACGKPVIATNYELNAKLIGQKDMFLFKEGDFKDLSEKIENLLNNEDLKEIGEKNFETIQKFSWENVSKKILGAIKEGIV